jgi:hypothetical protein
LKKARTVLRKTSGHHLSCEIFITVDRNGVDVVVFPPKPGHFSRTLSKGPNTTTWIWNLHADAHDFDSHTSDLEEISRKVFSAHFGQLGVIFIWLSGGETSLEKRAKSLLELSGWPSRPLFRFFASPLCGWTRKWMKAKKKERKLKLSFELLKKFLFQGIFTKFFLFLENAFFVFFLLENERPETFLRSFLKKKKRNFS